MQIAVIRAARYAFRPMHPNLFWLLVTLLALALGATLHYWYQGAYLRRARDDLSRQKRSGNITRPYALVLKATSAVENLREKIPNPAFQYSNRILESPEFPGLFLRISRAMAPTVCKVINDPTPKLERLVSFDYGDPGWKTSILDDFVDSSVIIVCPLMPSMGLQWELDTLRERGLIWKIFFVVPDEVDIEGFGLDELWRRSVRELKKMGIILPKRLPLSGILCQSKEMKFDLLLPWDRIEDRFLLDIVQWCKDGKVHPGLQESKTLS